MRAHMSKWKLIFIDIIASQLDELVSPHGQPGVNIA